MSASGRVLHPGLGYCRVPVRSKPLYEWIVSGARAQGLAGATVLRGFMGFGANSRVIHTFKIERLSEDLPIVVEIVETREKLGHFLSRIEPEIGAGLVTLEKAEVRFFRSQSGTPRAEEAG